MQLIRGIELAPIGKLGYKSWKYTYKVMGTGRFFSDRLGIYA